MRIALDARTYEWTGIGRYTRNLLSTYATLDTPHTFLVLLPRTRFSELAQKIRALGPAFIPIPVEPSYYSWQEQTLFLKQLYALNADVVHFTHFNRPLLYRRPYVVTIHDTTRFVFPGQQRQTLSQQVGYELVFRDAVLHASVVLCVSHATKKALQELPGFKTIPCTVTYEGIEPLFFKPVTPSTLKTLRTYLKTTDPYFVCVGVWMSHKNLYRLVDAFQSVHRRYPHHKLVITGTGRRGYVDIQAYAQDRGMGSAILFPGFVPHELLPALYAASSGLVFASLYEGFGLPALEAAAQGTPVICSNVTSLPEVMDDAALYVNPEYTPNIVAAMNRLVTEPVDDLITRAQERARLFTWEHCAQHTLHAYEQAGAHAVE